MKSNQKFSIISIGSFNLKVQMNYPIKTTYKKTSIMEDLTWKPIATFGDVIPPRTHHTCILDPSCEIMYCFGGRDGSQLFNDLFALNLNTLYWSQISCSGHIPSKRECHICCLYKNSLIVGFGFDGVRLNDVYQFDLTNRNWIKLKTLGLKPSNREECSGVIYKNSLYIFGGISIFGN